MADEETEALERFKLAGLFTKVKWLSWDLNMEGLAPTLVLLTHSTTQPLSWEKYQEKKTFEKLWRNCVKWTNSIG